MALCGYGAIALLPSLVVVALAKAAENSFDYSMETTVEQTLFLPTTREIKYTGKATVDTICVRLGDMAAGGLVLVCLHVFSLSRRGFAVANMILVGVWLVIAVAIARRHRRLAGDEPAHRRAAAQVPPGCRPIDLAAARASRGREGDGRPGGPFDRSSSRQRGVFAAALAAGWRRVRRRSRGARRSRIGRSRGRSTTAENVPRAPRATDLGELDSTLITRDDLAGEVDRALALEGARPGARRERGRRGAVLDLVLSAQPPRAADAGGDRGRAVGDRRRRLPLRIVKGKDRGAALGFQVVDADGRKFLLKLDPVGHLGMSTARRDRSVRASFTPPATTSRRNFVLDLGPGI